MNEHDTHAVVGQLYLALVEARAQNAALADLYRQAVTTPPENVTQFPAPEPQA